MKSLFILSLTVSLVASQLTGLAEDAECAPTNQCLENRECFFTLENYDIVKNTLFSVTHFPESCKNSCSCTETLYNSSPVNTDIIGKDYNSPICQKGAIQQALYFSAVGYPCEQTFIQAQKHIVELCGKRNGQPCLNATIPCEWYQIDKPIPFCEQRKGVGDNEMYIIGAYIFVSATLWSWTAGVDLHVLPSKRLQSRFRRSNEELMSFF